jgi:hypothetical protein
MTWWILGAIVAGVAVLAYLAQRLHVIDLSSKNRSSGRGSGIMSIGDEVFAPTRHEAAIEVNRQTLLPAPAPLAGDPDKGIYRGAVVIDLNSDRTRQRPASTAQRL